MVVDLALDQLGFIEQLHTALHQSQLDLFDLLEEPVGHGLVS